MSEQDRVALAVADRLEAIAAYLSAHVTPPDSHESAAFLRGLAFGLVLGSHDA